MSVKWFSEKCPRCGIPLIKAVEKCPECDFVDEENKIGKALFGVGIAIIILGVLGSFVLGSAYPAVETTYDYASSYLSYSPKYNTETSYNWMLAFAGCLSSAISGLLMMGFGELISLNQKNFNLLRK